MSFFFFFQAEDGIRDYKVTGVQTCALPIFNIVTPPAMPGVSIALGCRNSSTLALSNYGFLIKARTRVASCLERTSTLCSAVYAGTDRPAIIVRGEPVVESLWSRNVPSSPTANLGAPTQATSEEPGKRTTTCSPAWAPLMPSST